MKDASSDARPLTTAEGTGDAMHRLIVDLYPVCRSITGNGIRTSLLRLQENVKLAIHEVPSGTRVFDWSVPREWNIRDAFVRNSRMEKVVDFRTSNLHVMSYSVPVNTRMPLTELRQHLYSLPEQPDLIPYRTAYYKEDWGFCLSHRQLESLEEGEYEVVIDSSLEPGNLTYGELYLPGDEEDEFLISCHCCHPSLCNDNLSGMALATFLAARLAGRHLRLSYRFLFIPGAIGAITWLALNEETVSRIRAGLVVACVGDPGPMTYKKSRRGDAEIDRAVMHVLRHSGSPFSLREFTPYGYDERQYCSPGFNLPVGSLTRTPHGEFTQYHTSADNPDFVRPEALEESLRTYLKVVEVMERNRTYVNPNPKCEPQLGRRGLYSSTGGQTHSSDDQRAILWALNFSDGDHTLLDIADRSGMTLQAICHAADRLRDQGLLEMVEPVSSPDRTGAERTFERSNAMGLRFHETIPGGAHTYAKGDDQFPEHFAPYIVSGKGCRVRDADGNEFIEYGMGLRSVTLGHAHPRVVDAAYRQMRMGSNFVRPATIELECAEELLKMIGGAEMVKFGKNGSDTTSAAVKLSRAFTGRDLVAICAEHPFFSVDDWFIGTTAMPAGIPKATQDLTVKFHFNDAESLRQLFRTHPGRIACVMLEVEKEIPPDRTFLKELPDICHENGAILILDEMITGFRWHNGGGQAFYGITPDLSTFGKGIANGFSVAALAGKREIMQLGGIRGERERVFLLSLTHGGETHSLAAALATMRTYRSEPVIETLWSRGERLARGVEKSIREHHLEESFVLLGKPCCLVYGTRDAEKKPSQELRTLFLQETIRRGVLAPSFVVSYSHTEEDIDRTVECVHEALGVYRRALDEGIGKYLKGRPVKPVFRRFN